MAIKTYEAFRAPSSYEQERLRAERQRRYAELLEQQSMEPEGEFTYQGIRAMPSSAAALGKLLSAYQSKKARNKAEEAEARQIGMEQEASGQIAGRLTGRKIAPVAPVAPGAPVVPVDSAALQEQRRIEEEKNLNQLNLEEQAQLKTGDIQEVARQSQYAYDPEGAMQRAMTPQGGAAIKGNPVLAAMLQKSMETPKEAEYGTTPQFDKEGRAFVVDKAGNVRFLKDVKAPTAAPAAVTPTTIMKNGRKVVVDARTGTEIGLAPTDAPAPSGPKESAEGLRKEFTSQTSQYRGISDAFQKIKSAALNPSAANDISLIFGFMKALDPTSTVREGEAATAENARGVSEDVRNLYNKINSGQRLSQAQRQDFLQSAYGLVESQIPNVQQTIDRYTAIAGRSKLNPEDIVSDPFASVRIPRLQNDNDPMFEKLKSNDLFIAPNGKIMRKR